MNKKNKTLLFIPIFVFFNSSLLGFSEIGLQRDLVSVLGNTRPYLYKKILLTDTYKFCENPIQEINFLGYDNKKLTGKPVLYIDKSNRVILRGKRTDWQRLEYYSDKTSREIARRCKRYGKKVSAKYLYDSFAPHATTIRGSTKIPFFDYWMNKEDGFKFWIKVTKEHKNSYEVTYKGKPIFIAKSSIPLIIEKKKSGQEIFRELKIEKIYQEIFKKFREVIVSQNEEKMKEFFKKYDSREGTEYYKSYLNLSKKDIEYLIKVYDPSFFHFDKEFKLGDLVLGYSVNENIKIDLRDHKRGVFKIRVYRFEKNCEKIDCFKNQHRFSLQD